MVIRARNRVANNNLSFLFCELSFHTLGKDSVLHCPLLIGLWDFMVRSAYQGSVSSSRASLFHTMK